MYERLTEIENEMREHLINKADLRIGEKEFIKTVFVDLNTAREQNARLYAIIFKHPSAKNDYDKAVERGEIK